MARCTRAHRENMTTATSTSKRGAVRPARARSHAERHYLFTRLFEEQPAIMPTRWRVRRVQPFNA